MSTDTASAPPHRVVIRGGRLLTMDARHADGPGDIYVENGVITAIRPDPAPVWPDANVVDAHDDFVLPGLVDTHRHTWQSAVRHTGTDWDLQSYLGAVFFGLAPYYRAEDVYAGTLLGARAALDAGITTLLDWSHIQNSPAHTDAAIGALRAARVRAVFGYGWPQDDPASWVGESSRELPKDIRRVRTQVLADDSALVTMALAARGPELASLVATKADLNLARELGLPVTMHVGAGTSGAQIGAVSRLQELGLLDSRLTLVHACTTTYAELALAAAAGVRASVSPMIEMTMPGIGRSATGRLLAAGIRPGLSVDSEISTSGDMFAQMRAALAQHRLLANLDPAGRDATPGQPASPGIGAADVLRMATIDGAATLGIDDRIGSLTVGKRADIILISGTGPAIAPVSDPYAAIVFGGHPGLVHTVIVDGTLVKHRGELCDGAGTEAVAAARQSLNYLRGVAPTLASRPA